MLQKLCVLLVMCVLVAGPWGVARAAGPVLSHVNPRPLPVGHDRALGSGPMIYVDGAKGDDKNPGTVDKPLKSIQAGVNRVEAGQTVVVRGGTYYETVEVKKAGTPEKPITIRAYPKELVVIDGGYREFFNDPKSAWVPAAGGVAGEYESAKTYEITELNGLCANFGDTMVPLIVYRFANDMRSQQPYWTITTKGDKEENIYCGPGVWYDGESKKIHIRLAHTTMNVLGDDNYTGVTDPRQVPLVVGGVSLASPMNIDASAHIVLEDLVMRGGGRAACSVESSYDVEVNGCTLYAGFTSLRAMFTSKLRVLHTAVRGACAPWNFRGHMKYRSREAQVISASGWNTGGNEDLEIGYCELTDSIDGTFIGGVKRVKFHNNLVNNFTDDCIFVSANTTPDGTTQGGGLEIYENLIGRTLTTFSFGVGHGRQLTLDDQKKIKQLGAGLFIYRNIIDYRTPVHYNVPKDASEDTTLPDHGRLMGDHGSPTWEPIAFYQNSVIFGESDQRSIFPLSGAMGGGTQRRVFNNALIYARGVPGPTVIKPTGDAQIDANLVWSLDAAWKGEDPYARFKGSKDYALSKVMYPPGWMGKDVIKDPMFAELEAKPGSEFDLTPQAGSPAIGAGLNLPSQWPDPVRPSPTKRPDIGAIQTGEPVWRVGVQGRFDAFGRENSGAGVAWNQGRVQGPARAVAWSGVQSLKPVAIVSGYPEIDEKQVDYFLKRNHVPITFEKREWPQARELKNYSTLIVVDSPRGLYAPAELAGPLKEFVDQGGTLMVFSGATEAFKKMPEFLPSITGATAREKNPTFSILEKGNAWTKQLESMDPSGWMPSRSVVLPVAKGEVIVGASKGQALIARVPSGKGQLIYVGWTVSADKPNPGTRNGWAASRQDEIDYQSQVDVLKNIIDSVHPSPIKLESAPPAPVIGSEVPQ